MFLQSGSYKQQNNISHARIFFQLQSYELKISLDAFATLEKLWILEFYPERPLFMLITLAKTQHLFRNKTQVTLWNNRVCQHVTRLSYLEGRIQLMQQSVNQDVELQEVNSCVLQGCPDQMKKVPKEVTLHHQLRDELYMKDRTAWRALNDDLRRSVPQETETCFMSL